MIPSGNIRLCDAFRGIASLNAPAKRGFFPAGKDLSLISTSCIKIL